MAKRILTETACRKAKPSPHVTRLRDAAVRGLSLVISPAGNKAWSLNFTSPENEKRRSVKLGVYMVAGGNKPEMTLEEARDKARELRTGIRRGVDPIKEKAREKAAQEARERGTFGALLELYVEGLHAKNAVSAPLVERAFNRHIDARTQALPAASITRHHVMELMQNAAKRVQAARGVSGERAADLLRDYVAAAYEFAIRAQTSPKWAEKATPFELLEANPAKRVEKFRQQSAVGERHLSSEEVRTLWNESGPDIMSKDLSLFFKLALALGGQRVLELLHATWDEFDTEAGIWAIPMSRRKIRHKATHREPHLVPLTPLSLELLEQLREINGHSKYLFPNQSGKAPRDPSVLRKAIKQFCKHTSIAHFSGRDMRRTAKTLMGKAGLSKEVRDRLQGHAFSDISSKHYDRHDYWPEKRQAMEKWCRWLDELVTGKQAKVVPLRGGTA